MVQRKEMVRVKRRVWRVTQNAPLGEYVDPSELVPPTPSPVLEKAAPEPGWLVSSFELSHGVDVTDESDSIRGELFDELFMKK